MRKPLGLADAAITAGRTLRAALYDRVSRDKRGDARSVQEQEDANRSACEEHGWVVAGVYTDNDKSASRFANTPRDDWALLRGALANREYHVLVLWEPSRGDRDLLDWIGLLNLCRDFGILIHITSHGHTYDVRRRRDYKTLAEEGLDSADESEKGSERVTRTMESTAKKGLPHGQVLYGYRREYTIDDRGKRRLVGQFRDENPRSAVGEDGAITTYTPAGVVQEITGRLLEGEPTLTIAVDLNLRGIPSPRGGENGWSERTVHRMALNAGYAGLRVYQGQVIGPAAWPKIVEPADYYTLVSKLRDPARRTQKDTEVKHLGSGLYLCGVCGQQVRTVKRAKGRAYTCWPKKRKGAEGGPGFHVVRYVDQVDAYVQMSVWERLARRDIAELLAEDARADEKLAALTAEIGEKQVRLDEARDAYAAGHISLGSLSRIESTLVPEIESARSRMSESRFGPVLRGLVLPDVELIEQEWWSRSLPKRREVIRVLLERVEILPLGGRRQYEPDESVRLVWRRPNRD